MRMVFNQVPIPAKAVGVLDVVCLGFPVTPFALSETSAYGKSDSFPVARMDTFTVSLGFIPLNLRVNISSSTDEDASIDRGFSM